MSYNISIALVDQTKLHCVLQAPELTPPQWSSPAQKNANLWPAYSKVLSNALEGLTRTQYLGRELSEHVACQDGVTSKLAGTSSPASGQ